MSQLALNVDDDATFAKGIVTLDGYNNKKRILTKVRKLLCLFYVFVSSSLFLITNKKLTFFFLKTILYCHLRYRMVDQIHSGNCRLLFCLHMFQFWCNTGCGCVSVSKARDGRWDDAGCRNQTDQRRGGRFDAECEHECVVPIAFSPSRIGFS